LDNKLAKVFTAGIALNMLVFEAAAAKYHLVFWLKSVALIAFCFLWMSKDGVFIYEGWVDKNSRQNYNFNSTG